MAQGVLLGLQRILEEQQPARVVLPQLYKKHRQWGSRDRKTVGEMLFDLLRWKDRYAYSASTNPDNPYYYWHLIGVWSVLKNGELPPWEEVQNLRAETILALFEKSKAVPTLCHSFPEWMTKLGSQTYGEQEWQLEMEALNQTPTLTIRINSLKTTLEKLQQALLEDHNIVTHQIENYPDALVVAKTQKLEPLALFKEGHFEIQDANSQKVTAFCEVLPGQKVLDACCGAGGKSLHLATLMKNQGQLLASDIRAHKLDQLVMRANRNGIKNIQVAAADALPESWLNNTDVVLIDAPCSGSGVIRRSPETKWLLNPKKVTQLSQLQANLLQEKAQFVKPNGSLVYATCSLLKEENQDQIKSFLASSNGQAFALEKECLLMVHQTKFDGFYMARLRKKAISSR
ncbi:MAG: RsmB/NOP family class I SAM-dependent RNA methyltransferase [Flavobacteriaceae bacterium]